MCLQSLVQSPWWCCAGPWSSARSGSTRGSWWAGIDDSIGIFIAVVLHAVTECAVYAESMYIWDSLWHYLRDLAFPNPCLGTALWLEACRTWWTQRVFSTGSYFRPFCACKEFTLVIKCWPQIVIKHLSGRDEHGWKDYMLVHMGETTICSYICTGIGYKSGNIDLLPTHHPVAHPNVPPLGSLACKNCVDATLCTSRRVPNIGDCPHFAQNVCVILRENLGVSHVNVGSGELLFYECRHQEITFTRKSHMWNMPAWFCVILRDFTWLSLNTWDSLGFSGSRWSIWSVFPLGDLGQPWVKTLWELKWLKCLGLIPCGLHDTIVVWSTYEIIHPSCHLQTGSERKTCTIYIYIYSYSMPFLANTWAS